MCAVFANMLKSIAKGTRYDLECGGCGNMIMNHKVYSGFVDYMTDDCRSPMKSAVGQVMENYAEWLDIIGTCFWRRHEDLD